LDPSVFNVLSFQNKTVKTSESISDTFTVLFDVFFISLILHIISQVHALFSYLTFY